MSENPKKFKSKYALKLSDEKRAFVVIALTDKLSLAGKAAAANALAHYDSRKGYAYASVETMTRESGYAPSSTKTLNRGLNEIHDVSAFRVVRTKGGAKNTHHICPNMAWFRAEYDLLRRSGRIEEDEFADIRDKDQEEENPGSQPEMNWGSEHKNPGSGLHNRGPRPSGSGSHPNDPGSEPDEEGLRKRASEEDQKKSGPIGGLNVGDDAQHRPGANDNAKEPDADQGAKVEQWPVDMVEKFMHYYPKGGDISKISKALAQIQREGRTNYRDILRGAANYRREKEGVEPRYIKAPERFVTERSYAGYQKDNRPKPKMAMAI